MTLQIEAHIIRRWLLDDCHLSYVKLPEFSPSGEMVIDQFNNWLNEAIGEGGIVFIEPRAQAGNPTAIMNEILKIKGYDVNNYGL